VGANKRYADGIDRWAAERQHAAQQTVGMPPALTATIPDITSPLFSNALTSLSRDVQLAGDDVFVFKTARARG